MVKGNQGLVSSNPRRAIFEKRELDNRRRQENRQEIMKELQQDSLLMNTIASDIRVDRKRRIKQAGMQQLERETLRAHMDGIERADKIREELKREEDLAKEMQELHQDRLREQKMRQAIKEGSSELRELEQKLNYAYMNKERSLQLQEKQLMEKLAVAEDKALYGDWKSQVEKVEQEELKTQRDNHEKVLKYQQGLLQQVEEREKKRKEDYELFLKEKQMVDEIVKKIIDENEREAHIKLQKRQETKGFVEQFTKERKLWLELEQRRHAEENQKIADFARMQAEREQVLVAKKQMLAAGRDAIYDKLAADMENKEKLKIELEDLRIDLAQEEQEAQARKKDAEAMKERIRKRLETIDAYQIQIADKKARAERARVEEEAFREMLMKKFAEDDRIEQMKQTNRRMKQLEHRRAVDAIVAERKILLSQKGDEEKRQREIEEQVSRYKTEVIEQERQRLLLEHASKLAGFLPKGVLRDRKDLDLFDEEFRKTFEKISI